MSKPWILITGGSKGIGKAMVDELQTTWNVVYTSRSINTIKSENELTHSNNNCVYHYACDGSNEQDVNQLAPELLARFGAPFAIIHNAGITLDNLHIKQSGEQWRAVMETNLNSVFYWNRHLLPPMMEEGQGVLLLISSVTGIKGNIGQTAYGASKAAMIGLTKSLALEVARFGLRVNCLLPGIIQSDMTSQLTPEIKKKMRAQIPLRRFGTADEVAKVTRFMLDDSSQYMTGQTLVLDGGMTA